MPQNRGSVWQNVRQIAGDVCSSTDTAAAVASK